MNSMKKLFMLAALAGATAFNSQMATTAKADEGMWTLFDLPQAVYDKMVEEGCQMPCDELYNSDNALMKAVVNFSGYCTGVVVSPNGLVFTNHHCGFDAIRSHSTVEHDYMRDGFFAKNYEDELPNEDMYVSFMVEQYDVTDRVNPDSIAEFSRDDRRTYIDSLENVMIKEVREKDSTLRLELLPFYEGNKYYATTYRDYFDIRLVFAPTSSMGKFGGDTDNWMWPRQTCDFSVFRVYTDSLGKPAAYSKKNIPMKPERWAHVAKDGYKPGDFAMILGYPGSTERYLSSYGIHLMRDAENVPRIQVRGIKQQVMRKHMDESEAVRIKYDSKYATSSNYWKNSIGMNRCIDSLQLIQQKRAYEEQVKQYVDSTGYLKGKLDFDKMKQLYDSLYNLGKHLTLWNETFYRGSEFPQRAMKVAGELPLQGKGKLSKQFYVFEDNSSTYDEATDKELLLETIKNYEKQADKEWLPDFYEKIHHGGFKGDYEAYVDYLYKHSKIIEPKERLYIYSRKFQKDPGYRMGVGLEEMDTKLRGKIRKLRDSIAIQERYLCAAVVRMEQDMPHYSDANFTMRLTYGQVGGFRNGNYDSGYYTTAESLIEKMKQGDQIRDYRAEDSIQALIKEGDFGEYRDKGTGKMHLCFLTNNDITGGNSGSPVFNGKGELLGLAFDGNWEALSSDILFDNVSARTINVDIRFVMYLIDKWGKAGRLIDELTIDN